jgi:hypothetical protein
VTHNCATAKWAFRAGQEVPLGLNLGGGWTLYGENLDPSPSPFVKDFPLASFQGPGGTDFSNVSYMVFSVPDLGRNRHQFD